MNGKEPETKFDEQKSMNIQLRKMFLDAMKKDYVNALEREKLLEREEEQAAKQLALLKRTKERGLGEITESNIDPLKSRIGELSKAT